MASWGCAGAKLGPTTDLRLSSRDRSDSQSIDFSGRFDTAIYGYTDRNALTVLLIDGPTDAPRNVVEIKLLWESRAASTPVDRTATNVVVRLLDFREQAGESKSLGLYSGAGFLKLHGDPASADLSATLRQCDLRLTDRSERFTDRWGRLTMVGQIEARRDDASVTRTLREINQRVRDRLEYPRLVNGTHQIFAAPTI